MDMHELKIDPEYFQAIKDGKKTFELRKNDRDYKEGDILHLREWTKKEGYSGQNLIMRVIYILKISSFLGAFSWAIMSIKPMNYTNKSFNRNTDKTPVSG